MSVLYIKSLGTELKECQKENELLKKIIEIQNIRINYLTRKNKKRGRVDENRRS
jgi:hypothetical protein